MKIPIRKLLYYLDEKSGDNPMSGHITAIVGLIGEELNSVLFKYYNESLRKKVKIFDEPVKTGRQKGPRLDRWILCGNILYQTEIKNWSSWAIGGKVLDSSAKTKEIKRIARENWEREFKEHYNKIRKPGKVSKVLVAMKRPEKISHYIKIEPLVIHWQAINPDGIKPMFKVPKNELNIRFETKFTQVNYFSVSLYLRTLLKKKINTIYLNMPVLEKRLSLLNNLKR